MNDARIFVTRVIPEMGLSILREHFEVDVWSKPLPPPREELLSRVKSASGLLTLLSDKIDSDVFTAAGDQLKVVSNYAVGFNNIDVVEANSRKIRVGNTPDVLTNATADMAMCLLLAAARFLKPAVDSVSDGGWKTWEPLGFLGTELTGKTLGIIGAGRIGQAMAKRCHGGWGMRVVYSSRTAKPEFEKQSKAERMNVQQLLMESDFVSLHCDLNSETSHLINAKTLAGMRPGSILINTARGGVVDQAALVDALKNGPLLAAGLDVTDPEPLSPDHPLVSLANCIIAPHIGSATEYARDAMARIAAENIVEGIRGGKMPAEVMTSV